MEREERKKGDFSLGLPPSAAAADSPTTFACLPVRERERESKKASSILYSLSAMAGFACLLAFSFLFLYGKLYFFFLPHHEMKLKIEQKHIRGLWVFGNCNCHFIRICLRYLPTMGAAAPPPKRIAGSVGARERTRFLFHLRPQCPPLSANPIFFSPRSIFEKKNLARSQ